MTRPADRAASGGGAQGPGPAAQLFDSDVPYPLARCRAATARRGAVRILRDDRGDWCVVSEQRAPDRLGGWVLLVDVADEIHRVASFPPGWMLLAECELRDLIRCQGVSPA